MFFDTSIILLIPAIFISMYAQQKIQSTFAKYSRAFAQSSYTGYDVARMILDRNNLDEVKIEHIPGNLTDHYDPRTKILRLSDTVYDSRSIAAYGVAAHEVGHAIQHSSQYAPLVVRNILVPVVSFSSKFVWILVLLGLFLGYAGLIQIGIVLFLGIVVFQLVTLPVEFDASNRAILQLEGLNFLQDDEIVNAKKVLNAAALTYVAAALTAISQLIRLIMLSNRRR
ncbi:MAG: zinc metallopeptidase [Eubacteriales bacterium]|nr:zinc metallopeptidase [Eubacteriales bacterium]